jgi:hypothetical protein
MHIAKYPPSEERHVCISIGKHDIYQATMAAAAGLSVRCKPRMC